MCFPLTRYTIKKCYLFLILIHFEKTNDIMMEEISKITDQRRKQKTRESNFFHCGEHCFIQSVEINSGKQFFSINLITPTTLFFKLYLISLKTAFQNFYCTRIYLIRIFVGTFIHMISGSSIIFNINQRVKFASSLLIVSSTFNFVMFTGSPNPHSAHQFNGIFFCDSSKNFDTVHGLQCFIEILWRSLSDVPFLLNICRIKNC